MPSEFILSFEYQGRRYRDAVRGLVALGKTIDKDYKRMPHAVRTELRNFLQTVRAAMKDRHDVPWKPWQRLPHGDSHGKLHRRSGKMMKAFHVSVKGPTIETIVGTIGTRGVHAKIHEVGGTIRAKNVRYLTIPLPAALDSRGVPKKRSARQWANTFVARSRKGNLLIFQKHGKRITPLYALKPEVRIPRRLGLGRTLERGVPVFQDRVMDRMLDRLLTGEL